MYAGPLGSRDFPYHFPLKGPETLWLLISPLQKPFPPEPKKEAGWRLSAIRLSAFSWAPASMERQCGSPGQRPCGTWVSWWCVVDASSQLPAELEIQNPNIPKWETGNTHTHTHKFPSFSRFSSLRVGVVFSFSVVSFVRNREKNQKLSLQRWERVGGGWRNFKGSFLRPLLTRTFVSLVPC